MISIGDFWKEYYLLVKNKNYFANYLKKLKKFFISLINLEILTEQQKNELAKALIILKYSRNQVIVDEGDQSNSFYIIKEGTVNVYKGDDYIRSMRSGESFGESALLYNTPRQMSIRASSDTEVICMALAKDRLVEILKDQVHIIAYKNLLKWAFSKSNALSALTSTQREKVIEKMKLVFFQENDFLIKKGQEIKKLMILLNGEVKIEEKSKVFEPGNILFDEALVKQDKFFSDDNYKVGKCKGKITLSEITFEKFVYELGGNLEEILSHKEKPHEVFFYFWERNFLKTANFSLV